MKSLLLLALLSASEIVKDGAPPAPSAPLKQPGSERDHAQKAIETARSKVNRADTHPRHDEALAKLKEAEGFLQQSRYDEASKAADASWALVSEPAPAPTKMTVTVDDKGNTNVKSHSGRIAVEAGGATRMLDNGGTLQVDKGQPPRALLAVPQPTRPADNQRLTQTPVKSGTELEPVVISWQGVDGAERYEVELVPVGGGDKKVLPTTEPQLKVTLGAGAYRWSVRALAHEDRSQASTEQGFEVAQAPGKHLNMKIKSSNKWK